MKPHELQMLSEEIVAAKAANRWRDFAEITIRISQTGSSDEARIWSAWLVIDRETADLTSYGRTPVEAAGKVILQLEKAGPQVFPANADRAAHAVQRVLQRIRDRHD